MKKRIFILLLFLFCLILMNQSGNNIYARTTANNSLSKTDRSDNNSSLTYYSSDNVVMKSAYLNRIDSIVKNGIKDRALPGCQVLVMKDGKPVYNKCFGYYTYKEEKKVTPSTMYDLASLSKTTGTLLAIMKLYDNGELKLTDNASRYLTFLRGTDKENITIRDLLFHESGLPAGLPFYKLIIERNNLPSFLASTQDTINAVHKGICTALKYKENWVSKVPSDEFSIQVSNNFYLSNSFHSAAMKMIADAPLKSKTYCYSDLNFILLKEIAETISGVSMDVFLAREFYTPMKLNDMTYLPLRTHEKENIAPTLESDYLRNGEIQGYVNDLSAALLGGVSGNAGLFATAQDVATVYQMLLNNGEIDGKRYLSAETCRLFTTTTSANGRRGLGYDKSFPSNPRHSPCCISAPAAVYGHTGYTGTCCWVDPVNKLVYVFLSNRTYPFDSENKLTRMGIRSKIQEVIYQSMK
jgi:CubicO group peptidase (beta-lactamase class C family)